MNKVKDGYKITEVGEIPGEWNIKELDEITSIITKGTTPTTYGYSFENEGINFIKIESINDMNGTLRKNTFSKISEECHQKLFRSILQQNDILFAIAGATIGKCAIVTNDCIPANTNQALAIIRINKDIDEKFIFHQLRGPSIQNKIDTLKTNTAQPNLNLKQIGEFVILLPPLKEQQKISLILTSIDEKIENTDNLIEKTKELKKGLMQRLLTKGIGHEKFKDTEIGRIPEEWEFIKLKEVFKVTSGKFLPQKNVVKGEHPVYGGNGVTSYHNEYLFEKSKIVIGRVGEKCGCVCISEPKAWITDNALFIVDKITEFEDSYMFYLLSYMNLNQYANQNAQPVISGKKIYELNVAMPSVTEQKEIVYILFAIDEKINHYESKKEELQQLKKGLMQKLLTGKIRVRV